MRPEAYAQNDFIQNLLHNVPYPFLKEDIEKAISLYYLGTVSQGFRKGAITFPFIDKDRKIRTIQAKQFDRQNHTSATDFLHSMIHKSCIQNNREKPEWLVNYEKNELKVSCLFGEHLLPLYPYNPIALVEAPKTAIYGTLYFGFPDHSDDFLWLGVYNLSSLTVEKCRVLKGRNVFLFPDLSENGRAYDRWTRTSHKLRKLVPNTQFVVSNLIEKSGSTEQRKTGNDLADFLINNDWREFRKKV